MNDDTLTDISPHKIPRHIAVIMDGNGRWAVRQGEDRTTGHLRGAEVVKRIVKTCSNLRDSVGGPDYLTLYSFSIENWKRPMNEVAFLMQMYVDYLADQMPVMMQNNIRFNQIGRTDNLPDPVIDAMQQAMHATRNNTGLNLVLAINYGSRAEITDAVKAIAERVHAGQLDVRDITEQTISDHLYTSGWPDPDLLIRTAGEMRLSNYLLWQISYAELYVSDVLWPDFDAKELYAAIRSFAGRNRRFGALDHTNTLLPTDVTPATEITS